MPRAATKPRNQYDCSRCPAYCCSIYGTVEVTPSDVRRLADHLGLDEDQVRARHTRLRDGKSELRRKRDPVLGQACKFLDTTTRGCTIYAGRPTVCRSYPGQRRCAYFDVLRFERRTQGDPGVIPLIRITFPRKAAPR